MVEERRVGGVPSRQQQVCTWILKRSAINKNTPLSESHLDYLFIHCSLNAVSRMRMCFDNQEEKKGKERKGKENLGQPPRVPK